MKPSLQAFLHARDLDELLDLSNQLGELDETDHEIITSVLYQWQDLQAVANIMLHPRVMPRAQVLRYLIRAFEDRHHYLSLAAAVGLRGLGAGFFMDWHRAQLVDILVQKLDAQELDIVRQASVTVAEFVNAEKIPKLTRFLNHDDEIVRHNIVIAHRIALGVAATRDLLQDVLNTRPLTAESRAFLEQRLAEATQIAADPNPDRIWMSNLSGPLLSYIPNYSDWNPVAI